MGSILAIAGSGMRAAQQGVQAAAHNVANLATPGAQRLQVQRSTAVDGGGVKAEVTATASDPDALVADLVSARSEVLAFAANAALIRRSDDMVGVLLDKRG